MDYKKFADVMEAMKVNTKWWSQAEFKAICKDRKFSFIKTIDGDEIEHREVWGNRNFHIIVKHDRYTNEFQIL